MSHKTQLRWKRVWDSRNDITNCSDQILTLIKIVARLTTSKASQTNNKLNIPAGLLRVQGESLGLCIEPTLDLASLSDTHNYQVTLRYMQLSGPLRHLQLLSPFRTSTLSSPSLTISISDHSPRYSTRMKPSHLSEAPTTTTKSLRGDSHLHAGYNSTVGLSDSWSQLRCQSILMF